MAATEPIRNKKDLKRLADYWSERGNFRNVTLIILGACTALRISDLLKLEWSDVYDEEHGKFLSHITLTESKTGKAQKIALNPQAVSALKLYLKSTEASPKGRGVFIFGNNRKDEKPISRIQAWRIVTEAAKAIGLQGKVSCHSLRKTFGYHAWKDGVNQVLLVVIFNHSSFDVTKRYLGISQDDRDKVYRGLRLF